MASPSTAHNLLHFNGVNGATGDYGLPPMTGEELSQFIQGEKEPENLKELQFRHKSQGQDHFGVKEGVDPKKLDESGWGVIFAHKADPEIKEALAPLIDLRREQAGDRFRYYEGGQGYRVGKDTKNSFLARHKAGPGPADPEKVPYYLLIVGSPEDIPYRFQSQLDVQYAVGRIHFDTAEAYANYAQSVVAAESGKVKLARRMTFFGVANANDSATTSSTAHLVTPLFEKFKDRPGWEINAFLREEATKAQLARLIAGDQVPALLFTASHGMEFPLGDVHQIPHQGALLCGDWPGPDNWRGKPIPQDFYFAGDDLDAEAKLLGLVSFHFACYGAGTPLLDEFAKQAFKNERAAIAPHAFLASLPTSMLSRPKGGALAVVGHVERAWGYSFDWPGAGRQTTVFESTFERLLDGHPVGSALEYFNERYAELSTVLSDELEEAEFGKEVDPYEISGMWTANNDARGYLVLGDPAVRLPVAGSGETPTERPAIDVRTVKSGNTPDEESEPPAASGPREGVSFGVSSGEGGEVQFSSFHPRSIKPQEWQKLLVYAHLEAALDSVKTDAGQVLGKKAKHYRQAEAAAGAAIAPGTEITFAPRGEGLEFKPQRASLTWSGAWQRADFEMRATGQRAGHVVEGSVACYAGPLLIADIRLPVVVLAPDAEPPEPEGNQQVQSAKMYQAVFASYSHADTAVLEAVETAYKALGMDYLRDVMTLKSGQAWSDQLLKMIEQADVFQLFWSRSASESPYVEQEWQYALTLADRKGPAFIRPVYWEEPIPTVPGALSQIHFALADFSPYLQTAAVAEPAVSSPGSGQVTSTPALAEVPPQLAPLVPSAEEDLKTFTVSTYTATDPAKPDAPNLIARTHISLSGDVDNYVHETMAGGDQQHLELHHKTVKEALAVRLAYLELIAKLAGR